MTRYRYRKLRGRIVEKFGTQKNFAKHLGSSVVTVCNKLNGTSGFSQEDMEKWGNALEIKVDRYGDYFFA